MEIFWIPLSNLQYSSFFKEITSGQKKWRIIFTPNPEILLIAQKDEEYRVVLKKADFLLPDGVWLFLAFQILDSKNSLLKDIFLLPYYIYRVLFQKPKLYEKYGERICGSDLTKDLLSDAQKSAKTIAIVDLYNPNDALKEASQKVFISKLQEFFPWLKVNYYIWQPQESEKIIQDITRGEAVYLFSTLGMKKQEENIIKILGRCPNIQLGIWVGGSFDYFTGMQKRAPSYIRKIGFEWLYRLFFWPQKLKRIKRLWNAVIVFIMQVLREKI